MEGTTIRNQLDVDPIPTEWVKLPLRDVSPLQRGFDLPNEDIRPGIYPVVYSNGIGKYNARAMVCGPGVITGRSGTLGAVHYVESDYWPHNTSLWVTDFKGNSPKFIFYLFKYIGFARFASGSGVPTLNRNDAHASHWSIPTELNEQQAIAEALSDADALIEGLEKLIAKKRLIKQGAMQELLSPQQDWVELILGSSAQLKARIGWQGLTTAEYLDSGDYHLVTGTDFRGGFIDWSNCHFVDKYRYDQDKNIQLRESDVLVTKDGTIGKVAFIEHLPQPATLNSGVFVVRPRANALRPKFLYYLLMSPVFEGFLARLSAGSTISHLYQKDFVGFSFLVPPTLENQDEIAAALLEMDLDIKASEARLAKAQQMKQALMQELLTGRIRLV